jgi:hypothetical protein
MSESSKPSHPDKPSTSHPDKPSTSHQDKPGSADKPGAAPAAPTTTTSTPRA